MKVSINGRRPLASEVTGPDRTTPEVFRLSVVLPDGAVLLTFMTTRHRHWTSTRWLSPEDSGISGSAGSSGADDTGPSIGLWTQALDLPHRYRQPMRHPIAARTTMSPVHRGAGRRPAGRHRRAPRWVTRSAPWRAVCAVLLVALPAATGLWCAAGNIQARVSTGDGGLAPTGPGASAEPVSPSAASPVPVDIPVAVVASSPAATPSPFPSSAPHSTAPRPDPHPSATPHPSPTPQPTWDPSPTRFIPISVQAEDPVNVLVGGAAVVGCPTCDGGARVRYIAGTSWLDVNLDLPTAGTRTVTVEYESDGPRFIEIAGGAATLLVRQVTGVDWQTPMVLQFTAALPAGRLVLKFYNDSGPAPDVDKVSIS